MRSDKYKKSNRAKKMREERREEIEQFLTEHGIARDEDGGIGTSEERPRPRGYQEVNFDPERGFVSDDDKATTLAARKAKNILEKDEDVSQQREVYRAMSQRERDFGRVEQEEDEALPDADFWKKEPLREREEAERARREKEEAERKRREEAERKRREEEERIRREKEEAERIRREEAERRQREREEAERKRREEEERLRKEREEAERKRREEEERIRKEKEEAARKRREEEERIRKEKEEAAQKRREEKERIRKEKEEARKKAKEEKEKARREREEERQKAIAAKEEARAEKQRAKEEARAEKRRTEEKQKAKEEPGTAATASKKPAVIPTPEKPTLSGAASRIAIYAPGPSTKALYGIDEEREKIFKKKSLAAMGGAPDKERENEDRPRNSLRKSVLVSIVCILISLGCLAAGGYAYLHNVTGKMDIVKADVSDFDIDPQVAKDLENYENIAILGIDARKNEKAEDARSDAIIIARIQKDTGEVQLISVMRDSYLQIEGPNGKDDLYFDKVTHAHVFGGPMDTCRALNRNLDLNISEFMVFNWQAVADLVDEVGGITVNIKEQEIADMNHYGNESARNVGGKYKKIKKAGKQKLNGAAAVTYCRIRKTSGGDPGRGKRYKTVMSALLKKATTMNPGELNRIANKIFPEVTTNIKQSAMLGKLTKMQGYHVTKSYGWPKTYDGGLIGGVWYAVPDTLSSNVKWLHKKAFGQEKYTLTARCQELHEKVDEAVAAGGGQTITQDYSNDGGGGRVYYNNGGGTQNNAGTNGGGNAGGNGGDTSGGDTSGGDAGGGVAPGGGDAGGTAVPSGGDTGGNAGGNSGGGNAGGSSGGGNAGGNSGGDAAGGGISVDQ